MLKAILLPLVLFVSVATFADSKDPCEPTVRFLPMHISCMKGKIGYSMTISGLMSPAECQGAQYRSIETAKISVSDAKGEIAVIDVHSGKFSYVLSIGNDTNFVSNGVVPKFDRCVAPLHGGISAGNAPRTE